MDLAPTLPWVPLLTCTKATVLQDQARESHLMDMDILVIRDRGRDTEVLQGHMDLVLMVRGRVDLQSLVSIQAILLTLDLGLSIQVGMDPMLLLAKEDLLHPDNREDLLQVILG